MRIFIISTLFFFIACNNLSEQGFTNKAEARNELKNGVKEGKWIEYIDSSFNATTDSTAPYYGLIIYNAGEKWGMIHEYYKNGKILTLMPSDLTNDVVIKGYYENGLLHNETPYTSGKINGDRKEYYSSGELHSESQYVNDKINGVVKIYYKSGKLKEEDHYSEGKVNGLVKGYYESGKLQSEITYANDSVTSIKNYDENEIKE